MSDAEDGLRLLWRWDETLATCQRAPMGGLSSSSPGTIQGRYLLRPSRRLNQITVGVLARAQRISGAIVHAFTCLSNHLHVLASFTNGQQMAIFEWYLKGNLARKANRLHDWSGKLWHRRYQPIPVSDEPEAQLGRLKYVLAQGCVKEGLVASPLDRPGATSMPAPVETDQ